MAQAAVGPRWELQLWSTSVKTSTGKESTAQGKQAECLLRLPLDAPTRVGAGMWRASVCWITQLIEPESSQPPLFDGQAGPAIASPPLPAVQRCITIDAGFRHPTLTRDALVKLVHTSDSVVLGQWTIPFDSVKDLPSRVYHRLPAGDQKQLWLSGVKAYGKTSKFEVQGIVVGHSLLEEEPLCSVVRTLRDEHRAEKLSQAVAFAEFKRSAFKRAREELEDAERAEQRWRAQPQPQP